MRLVTKGLEPFDLEFGVARISPMDGMDQKKPVTGLVVGILSISVIGGILSLMAFRALSIPSTLRSPLSFIVLFLAIFPFISRWPNKPGQRPLTFWRWAVIGLAGAIAMFAVNYVFYIYFPDR